MSIGNIKITNWNATAFNSLVHTEQQKRLDKAGFFLENEIRKNISTKGVSCGKRKGNRSQPGQPPFIECGQLRQSVTHELNNNECLTGSNLDKAKYLELGTKNMQARPFLLPALTTNTQAITNILIGTKYNGC